MLPWFNMYISGAVIVDACLQAYPMKEDNKNFQCTYELPQTS